MIIIKNYSEKTLVLFILLFGIFTTELHAQTEPMYSQYMYNMLSVNPAYAGNRGVLNLNSFYRKQWVGIPGAPETKSISLDGPLNERGLGFGVQLFDDRLGVEKVTGINTMLSTQVKVSETGVLSAGLLAGLMNYRTDLTQVENRFNPSDPSFSQNYNKWMASVGIGLFYNTDRFYLGASIPNVLRSRLATFNMIQSGIQNINDYHLFITSGIVLELNEDVKIKPSTMFKMVSGAPIEFDLNTNVWVKDMVGFGVSYRTGDAVLGMLELQATKKLRFGYAYDTPISDLRGTTSGSHELLIRYEFGRNNLNIKSTRYF